MPSTSRDTAEYLDSLQGRGNWTRLRAYTRLSGPGWLQSAITLGGGSLASALFLGVVGGYAVLWVQAGAIILGVIMLAAIGYVTLSTGESPFESMRTRINPVLAWGWILAALAANMVFVLPQYSLAFGALTENIFPSLGAHGDSLGFKMGVSLAVLAVVTVVTFLYGSGGPGIRIYETIVKAVVGMIVVTFILVVGKLALSGSGLPLGRIFAGFVPDPGMIFAPSEAYQRVLETLTNDAARTFWSGEVLAKQRTVLVAAASAAVGINMTFMLPYSMRARGWTRSHRGLATFDLATGMVLPFILATSCIVIASGFLFHGKPYEGVLEESNGQLAVTADPAYAAQAGEIRAMLAKRPAGIPADAEIENGELQLAAMLLNRSNRQFARSLETLVGANVAHLIFGIGVLGMALSTISACMVISGFVVCEILKRPIGSIHFKLGSLLAATGVLWPVLWTGSSKAYLAVPAFVFGYTLVPVAFLAFFLMMNSRRLLGDSLPAGRRRITWNVLMGITLAVTGTASIATAWGKSLAVAGVLLPIGKIFIIGYGLAIVAGHYWLKNRGQSQVPE
jgi:Mn2+/Fe2+ NRAMP family transporter